MAYVYEVFLSTPCATKDDWIKLLAAINDLMNGFEKWHIEVRLIHETIHYYIESSRLIPVSPGVSMFLLKKVEDDFAALPNLKARPYLNKWGDCFLSIAQNLSTGRESLYAANLTFWKIGWKVQCTTISIYSKTTRRVYKRNLLLIDPEKFLSVNFLEYQSFNYKKTPKYFKIDKLAGVLENATNDAVFEVDTFPYFCDQKNLRHDAYDFTKHSLVLGGSGAGKSRFLTSLVNHIYQDNSDNYKVVIIDPHDALYQDCGLIESRKVIDFCDQQSDVDLFCYTEDNITSNIETIVSLFRMIIGSNYNGRLERVLRYSAHLLIIANDFNFLALQKLLKDTDFRNQLITKNRNKIPRNVVQFFLTDFNELRTQNYNDAIAPILALIDEMLIVPTFSGDPSKISLHQIIEENFLNIFSLNQLRLGEKVVQIIAGLLMQQLFVLAESGLKQHLIVIIDEVAIIEQPILARFLSELRKYRVTVILASQYLAQVSENLRMSIFANVTNYYIFRTSQDDANTLSSYLKIKPVNGDDNDEAEKIITKLNNRECLVRVMNLQGEIIPAFKARVANFDPPPCCKTKSLHIKQDDEQNETDGLDFCFDTGGCDIDAIGKSFSTSRKKLKE